MGDQESFSPSPSASASEREAFGDSDFDEDSQADQGQGQGSEAEAEPEPEQEQEEFSPSNPDSDSNSDLESSALKKSAWKERRIVRPKGRLEKESVGGWNQSLNCQATIYHLSSLSIPSRNRIPIHQRTNQLDFVERSFIPQGERQQLAQVVKEDFKLKGKPLIGRSNGKANDNGNGDGNGNGDDGMLLGRNYDWLDNVVGSNRRNQTRLIWKSLVESNSNPHNANHQDQFLNFQQSIPHPNASRDATHSSDQRQRPNPSSISHLPLTFDPALIIPSNFQSRHPTLLDENDIFRRKYKGGVVSFHQIDDFRDFFNFNAKVAERRDEQNAFGWGWIRTLTDPNMPDSSLLSSLHHYASHFYSSRNLLLEASLPIAPLHHSYPESIVPLGTITDEEATKTFKKSRHLPSQEEMIEEEMISQIGKEGAHHHQQQPPGKVVLGCENLAKSLRPRGWRGAREVDSDHRQTEIPTVSLEQFKAENQRKLEEAQAKAKAKQQQQQQQQQTSTSETDSDDDRPLKRHKTPEDEEPLQRFKKDEDDIPLPRLRPFEDDVPLPKLKKKLKSIPIEYDAEYQPENDEFPELRKSKPGNLKALAWRPPGGRRVGLSGKAKGISGSQKAQLDPHPLIEDQLGRKIGRPKGSKNTKPMKGRVKRLRILKTIPLKSLTISQRRVIEFQERKKRQAEKERERTRLEILERENQAKRELEKKIREREELEEKKRLEREVELKRLKMQEEIKRRERENMLRRCDDTALVALAIYLEELCKAQLGNPDFSNLTSSPGPSNAFLPPLSSSLNPKNANPNLDLEDLEDEMETQSEKFNREQLMIWRKETRAQEREKRRMRERKERGFNKRAEKRAEKRRKEEEKYS